MEFFTSPENFRALEPKLKAAPSITYMAVNAQGDMISNVGPTDVNAVTWGVFPAKEIVQPTVVDPQSFAVWKVRPAPSCSVYIEEAVTPRCLSDVTGLRRQAMACCMCCLCQKGSPLSQPRLVGVP